MGYLHSRGVHSSINNCQGNLTNPEKGSRLHDLVFKLVAWIIGVERVRNHRVGHEEWSQIRRDSGSVFNIADFLDVDLRSRDHDHLSR